MLLKETKIRDVSAISLEQKQSILDFLQGCIYCWCNNNPNQWFSLRDLMGNHNYDWHDTPLIFLYEKHRYKLHKSNEISIQAAGKDAGWLLKKVIHEDKRKFDTKKENLIRQYKWIK